MDKRCLGLDVGGANIKVADTVGYARSWPFPMWEQVDDLPGFLGQVLNEAPAYENLAVTMTGELADCFQDKNQGVQVILDAVAAATAEKQVRVYLVDGSWATLADARTVPALVAAANWHALARFVSLAVQEPSMLLLDVGSTTTDVIPVIDGAPRTEGQDDTSRLLAGELVYTGVERSPVCSLVETIPYRGQMCGVAAEWFATTLDVYLLLDELPESIGVEHTGDGTVRDRSAACGRMARMACADREQFSMEDAVEAARWIAAAQATRLCEALQRVAARWTGRINRVVVSGHGDFLARRALVKADLDVPVHFLSESVGMIACRSGPAYALAMLAGEEWVS